MKNEQMLKLSYETDMPAEDQIYCYLSCNVRITKGEKKKEKKKKKNNIPPGPALPSLYHRLPLYITLGIDV